MDAQVPHPTLIWPELVPQIASAAPAASQLYLVGGIVRDAVIGRAAGDIDLATPGDGLRIARRLADALDGAYYPIDPERRTGRVILKSGMVIDVAAFRGPDLLADLAGRDFTINAMAARLDSPEMLIDPLGGQADLLERRVLRQCSPSSIADDPVRALRAVRLSLQFSLRLTPETRAATQAAARRLTAPSGDLDQPERCRDEFFTILGGRRASGGIRLLSALGLLPPLSPHRLPEGPGLEQLLALASQTWAILTAISPRRDDNLAANLMMGTAVMVLDRFRRQLQEHFGYPVADRRTRGALLLLHALTPEGQNAALWADRLRLSGNERRILEGVTRGRGRALSPPERPDDRRIYQYYRLTGDAGVDALVLELAAFLANDPFSTRAREWGMLLDEVASPLLDACFRRHQQVIAPPALLSGDDLMAALNISPGPALGNLMEQLREEQASGQIRTKKQAIRRAKQLLAGAPPIESAKPVTQSSEQVD